MIPTVRVTPQGFLAPTREEITAGLWVMFREAFGDNLTQDSRTPQGQLVTSLTAIMREKDAQLIELGNNFDPRYSTGKWQEALGAIYFLERRQEVSSVVQLEFMGAVDSVIPVGQEVKDDNGNEWVTTQSGKIGSSGVISLWAKAVIPGPISAAADTITQLVNAPTGIDRVTNPSLAAVGSLEETRVDYEIRRAESVAANGKNTNANVLGAINALPGVIDVYVIDNPLGSAITVGSTNYPMPQHSLLASVVGGDDLQIAEQVLIKGGTGCTFVGNTEVTYLDESLGYVSPPAYKIRFERPSTVPVYFRVVVANMNNVTAQASLDAKNAIIEQTRAGANKFRINGRVIASSYLCGLSRDLQTIDIDISTDGVTWEKSIVFGVDQFPVAQASDITITDSP